MINQIEFFAHSLENSDGCGWQPLADHLIEVSNFSGSCGQKFKSGDAAALAGLLHDLGKYSDGFQQRLRGGERVDHATAGTREVVNLADASSESRMMAQLIAHCIAGHHGGLPDSIGELDKRLDKDLEPLSPVWRDQIHPDPAALTKLPIRCERDRDVALFQIGFLGRMLFSCLVDADFRDTESFYANAENLRKDRDWPALPKIVDALIEKLDRRFADLAQRAEPSKVNELRAKILAQVRAGAARPRGAFSLNVPTGGGKTLASLAFALDHARRHGMERIIYAIPFTSVIDQTATIFKGILGDDVVLEHHSSIDEEKLGNRSARDKLRLAMEDWAAPIVVTTNVQLFESLHSHRPSRCRRLHNLANAVIVLDEAQTIPLPVLRPCVAALDELTRNYGASVVICTATQPAIAAPNFHRGLSLDSARELAPDPHVLHEQLRRVRIRDAGALDDATLLDELADVEQGLVIVNSRAHALALFRAGQERGLAGLTHLTTRQCAAHRREILARIRENLTAPAPCRMIATSLIEAGVDIDFPRVWRARAGLDQIAQAAGRCNREGLRPVEQSIVTLFDAPDHKPPHELQTMADCMREIARKHPDMLSPAAIEDYFRDVYWFKGEERLDKFKVLQSFKVSDKKLDFSYRRIGDDFRLIESGMESVIIPYDDQARETLEKLRRGFQPAGAAARALQSYLVQIPPRAREALRANGHVQFVEQPGVKEHDQQFAVLETPKLYHDDFGLFWEDTDYLPWEEFMSS